MGFLENIIAYMSGGTNKVDQAVAEMQSMVAEPVNSSWIDSVKYNPGLKAMTIVLEDSVYTYYNVGPEIYAMFERAPSKGTFINKVIKSGFYPFSRA